MKLLHLYHDIMNLYGDYANVLAMQRILQNSGETVEVDRLSLGSEARLDQYDFIFIGSGTERNQKVVLEDIRRFRDDLKRCMDGGKVMLFTGNSFELLGKTVTDADGRVYDGLGLFGFTSEEQNKTRMTADAVFGCGFLDSELVGFVNKCSRCRGIEEPLFEVKLGLGNCDNDKGEGVRAENLFGTHLTGPVLMKNPHFLIYLASLILNRAPSEDGMEFVKAGFEVTLSELKKRMEKENN